MVTPSLIVLVRLNYSTSNSNLYSCTIEPAGDPPNKGPSPYPTMPDITITSQGIENLLNGLKTYKASGPDAISATILKETSDIVRCPYPSSHISDIPRHR